MSILRTLATRLADLHRAHRQKATDNAREQLQVIAAERFAAAWPEVRALPVNEAAEWLALVPEIESLPEVSR